MTTQTATEQEARELYEVASKELAAGRHPRQITAELVGQKWPKPAAQEFVALVGKAVREQRLSHEGRAKMVKAAVQQIQSGGVWAVAGCAATFFKQSFGENSGLSLLAYLAIFYGVFEMVWGGLTWWQYHEPEPAKPAAPKSK